jgi:hypothetical protein
MNVFKNPAWRASAFLQLSKQAMPGMSPDMSLDNTVTCAYIVACTPVWDDSE